jgi:hypothetical protein
VKAIRELKHLNIYVHELGEFRFAKSKLEGIMERGQRTLDTFDPESPYYKFVEGRMEKFKRLLELRQEEYQKREEAIKRKDDYKTKNSEGLDQ